MPVSLPASRKFDPFRLRLRTATLLFAVHFLPPAFHFGEARASEDGIHFVIQFAGGPNVWSEMAVSTVEGGHSQRAITRFIPNRVDSKLRYFPARFEGEIIAVPLEGIHVTDEEVVEHSDGVYRPATESDPRDKVLLLTRTFALDSRGRVTFFHGVIRAHGIGDVVNHLVWGYPPETSLQETHSKEDPKRDAK